MTTPSESEMTLVQKLEALLGEIERQAFLIPAPNPFTPVIVQAVIECRVAIVKAHEADVVNIIMRELDKQSFPDKFGESQLIRLGIVEDIFRQHMVECANNQAPDGEVPIFPTRQPGSAIEKCPHGWPVQMACTACIGHEPSWEQPGSDGVKGAKDGE